MGDNELDGVVIEGLICIIICILVSVIIIRLW